MYWTSVQRMIDLMDVGKLIFNFGCLGAKHNDLCLPILREISLKLWCVSLFLKKRPFSSYSICTSTKLLFDSLNYLLGQYCKSHEAQNPFTSTVGERTKKGKNAWLLSFCHRILGMKQEWHGKFFELAIWEWAKIGTGRSGNCET